MTACSTCGEANPDHARFCLGCGSQLAPRKADVRKMVTVVFTDIVGSTDLGERLDPEALKGVLTEYFGRMRVVLERHGGLLEKYIGDAIMGVFGVPRLHEDDAVRAIRAAAEMRAALHDLNDELADAYGVRISARTGVNTGEVLQGDIVNGQTLAFGDTVNVAARLEQAAGPDEILIGKTTFDLTRQDITAEPVDPLALKGKSQQVRAYRVLSLAHVEAPQGRETPALVGRAVELAALHAAFARVTDDRRCERVTIIGSAGVGKSRLIYEFVAGLQQPATVVWGRCLPYGDQITYWPVRELVRDAIGAFESDSADVVRNKVVGFFRAEEQGALAAELLGQLLGLEAPSTNGEELAWAVRRFLEHLARDGPAVVLLDDLQWADPAMLELLSDVQARIRDVPLLFVGVSRSDFHQGALGLTADLPGSTFVLEPLGDSDAHTLIANLLGGSHFPEEVRSRVVDAAEGNPLFVEQLLGMLIDQGQLERGTGGWTLVGGLAQIDVPPTIRALLATRLDLLEDEERRVVDPAAVVGKVFQRAAVADLIDAPLRPRMEDLLDALVDRDLIKADPVRSGQQLYRFRHLLIRDAAYEAMAKRRRAELHESFARWLQVAAGDRVDEYEEMVGYHLEQAYHYRAEIGSIHGSELALGRTAAGWLTGAARRNTALGATQAAASLLQRAVNLLSPDDPARLGVLLDLCDALLHTGKLVDASELIAEARRKADNLLDANASARARVLSLLLRFQLDPEGTAEQTRQESRELLTIFTECRDDLGLARTWRLLAHIDVLRCQWGLAGESFQRAADHALAGGDRREECDNLSWLVVASVWGPAPATHGLQLCSDVLDRSTGDRRLQTIALLGSAVLQAMIGDTLEARSLSKRAIALIDELGPSVFAVVARGQTCAYVEMYAGDAPAAEREALISYRFLDEYGDRIWLSSVSAILAQATYAQGRWTDAQQYVDVAVNAAASDDLDAQIRWRGVEARLLARDGRLPEAERMARDALERAETTDFLDVHGDVLAVLAELLAMQARRGEAADALAGAITMYERKGNLTSAAQARAMLTQLESDDTAPHVILPVSSRVLTEVDERGRTTGVHGQPDADVS